MQELIEQTKNFEPVELIDATWLYDYFIAFNQRRIWPRFFESVLELSQYVNVPVYWRGIINNCLVILKKAHLHTPNLYLILPPISLKEDKVSEIETMHFFSKFGCHTRLSEEDISYYQLKNSGVDVVKGNAEFIYHLADVLTMPGKKWKKFRNKINIVNRPDSPVNWSFSVNKDISPHDIQRCELLYKQWLQSKERNKMGTSHKKLLDTKTIGGMESSLTYLETKEKKMITFCISERIGDHILMNTGFRDYNDTTIDDPNFLLHYIECRNWAEILPEGACGNSGAGLVPSLIFHKTNLLPVKIHQMYNLKTPIKLTKEVWKSVCTVKPKKEASIFG
jgi:hypothetical protein